MSLTDRLFGRKGGTQIDLAGVQAVLADGAARYAGRPVEPDLVRARLADGWRDAGLPPLPPEGFAALARGLDEEAWRRLLLLTGALGLEDVRGALPVLAAARHLPGSLEDTAFVELARQTPLLTLELLRQGPLRVEELARRFVAGLGAGVRGESAAVSRQRLERLDYGRLLAEAERAKQAAEERVEKLRKLQEERDRRRAPRGKW